MFVERPGEVTLEQFVIVHSFGNDAAHKLVIAEVVAVAVGGGINGVRDPISWGNPEQGVHRVKDFPGNDDVPFPE